MFAKSFETNKNFLAFLLSVIEYSSNLNCEYQPIIKMNNRKNELYLFPIKRYIQYFFIVKNYLFIM